MEVSKTSKYQTHKKSIKLTKNLKTELAHLSDFLTSIVVKYQKIEGTLWEKNSHNAEKKGTL